MSNLDSAASGSSLTDAQRAQIERNRQHALLLKQARIASRPYPSKDERSVTRIENSKLIDSGGGFFIEETEASNETAQKMTITHPPAPIIPPEVHSCEECERQFSESFLYSNFTVAVCDDCRDDEDKHSLITKTDAKTEFLLKDLDFDKREPPLKFIRRKNSQNARWGEMKLFLRSQVRSRALEIWGSEEGIEEEREKREENRNKLKQKKFNKKVKELRMAVRSSVYKKDLSAHAHEYGEETYNEDDDTFSKTCLTCGQTVTYEKM